MKRGDSSLRKQNRTFVNPLNFLLISFRFSHSRITNVAFLITYSNFVDSTKLYIRSHPYRCSRMYPRYAKLSCKRHSSFREFIIWILMYHIWSWCKTQDKTLKIPSGNANVSCCRLTKGISFLVWLRLTGYCRPL